MTYRGEIYPQVDSPQWFRPYIAVSIKDIFVVDYKMPLLNMAATARKQLTISPHHGARVGHEYWRLEFSSVLISRHWQMQVLLTCLVARRLGYYWLHTIVGTNPRGRQETSRMMVLPGSWHPLKSRAEPFRGKDWILKRGWCGSLWLVMWLGSRTCFRVLRMDSIYPRPTDGTVINQIRWNSDFWLQNKSSHCLHKEYGVIRLISNLINQCIQYVPIFERRSKMALQSTQGIDFLSIESQP